MATRSDILLAQAMSQFGAGLGSMMGRRRQRKDAEEFAEQYTPMTMPEQMMDPRDSQLIETLSSGMPGMAGLVGGAGMQGNQMMRAAGQSEQANAQAMKLRKILEDPQAAAMAKQAIMQQQFAPKPVKAPVSLGGGRVGVFDQKTGQYDIKDYGEKKNLKDRWMTVNGDVYDRETIVDGAPKLAIEGVSDNGKVVTVGVGDKKSTAWYDPDTGSLDMLGDPMEFGKSQVTTIDGSAPTKTTTGKIQTNLMSVDKTRAAYQRTLDSLGDGKFLTYGDKAWRVIQGGLDKSGAERIFGQILDDDSWAEYEKATTFKQNTMKSVNAHIKELTGAQMSHYEIPRLMSEMPNMMDSPRAFKVKIENVIAVADEAHATMANYIENGMIVPGFHDVYLETKKKWEGQASPEQIEEIAILEAAQAMAASAIANEIQFGGDGRQTPGFVEE